MRDANSDPTGDGEPPVTAGSGAGGSAPSLREALAADPLGLASHRDWDGEDAEPPRSPGWALVRFALIVAAVIVFAFLLHVGVTVLLVGALVVCILLHELGHFLTAKAAGMKVTQFFFGFGPTLWSVQRGETEYGVKAFPLGGFCRIIGMHNLEEVDPADEARTYRQRPLWRRLSVAVAGSAMHCLIALVVLFAMFFWAGDSTGYLTTPASNPIVGIDKLASGASPAMKAGFRLGDRIVSVDGHHFADFTAQSDFIRAHPDRRLTVVVRRHDRLVTLYPTPVNLQQQHVVGAGAGSLGKAKRPTGFIGIEVSSVVHSSFGASVSHAFGMFGHYVVVTVNALGRLVTLHGIHSYLHMLTNARAANTPSGESVRFESPVGVVSLLHTAAGDGIGPVLYLLGVINISLGLLNMFPMLPLDGGHVVIALYEGARSRKRRRYHADVAKLLPLMYLMIAIIVFIGGTSLFLDVRQLAS
ncbi:MAG TPA: M50 family metallopeptidase [Acidimicrobiales bacterium]|nr:M50 family metallopeptidase [Acidimicrobiales bacterium]